MYDLMNVMRAEIEEVKDEAASLKTFTLKTGNKMLFKPGQFVLVSRLGIGESAFAISSDPTETETFSISVQAVGKHTESLHELDPGDVISVRGPYGNSFPVNEWKNKNVFIVAGGIGMAPLRPVIYSLLKNRSDFGNVTLVCGARTPQLMPYGTDLADWADKIDLHLTVDRADENWNGKVGVVTKVVDELSPSPNDTVSVICGPPVMIKFTRASLSLLGFKDDQIYTTLEMKMKCGVGICGRCNIDHRYICKDGPVFRLDQLAGSTV